ncbi:type II secretion system protein [Permianibacter sp. IMCC34836]|uniref:type IV pilus modification PilV family protein n=1 Tax=Permianibacter fluminis TaxID=2738515 RepID=UPI00155217D2|nr:type II secretion system protein [Permianibacter fluminis]NQD37291.1 type II secretion system protein [Permianibacter fluminis]
MPVEPRGRLGKTSTGFSLIELIVTIVVTAIALTALGVGLLTASRNSADPIVSMRAATLAQAYLDEILSKRFDENNASGGVTRCGETGQPACTVTLGAEAGETRANYDDVDDYHGLNESPPINALGTAQSNYDGFRVQISVGYAGSDFNAGFGLLQPALKKITVTVTAPIGGSFVFAAYRGNF